MGHRVIEAGSFPRHGADCAHRPGIGCGSVGHVQPVILLWRISSTGLLVLRGGVTLATGETRGDHPDGTAELAAEAFTGGLLARTEATRSEPVDCGSRHLGGRPEQTRCVEGR